MRVFKFGGASVKDANGVRNLVKVLEETGHQNTFLVVSAMGKMTNAMEVVVKTYFDEQTSLKGALEEVRLYHQTILQALFENKEHPVYKKVNLLFEEVSGFLAWNKSPNYSFVYDQVVGYGELLSTTIVSTYLNEAGIKNHWIDIRDFIKTDDNYRDGRVKWEKTQQLIA